MSLISYSEAPYKGGTVTATLNKTVLVSLDSIASDPWWSDETSTAQAIVTIKSAEGKERIVLTFDFSQFPCTAPLSFPQYCRDQFVVDKILLIDTMGDKLTLSRAALIADYPTLAAESDPSL